MKMPEPCKRHRKYRALEKPRSECEECWRIWRWSEIYGEYCAL